MTGLQTGSSTLKLPHIKTGSTSTSALTTTGINQPRDQLQSQRDYLQSFQERFRYYLSNKTNEESSPEVARIQKLKQHLNKTTPFRLQSHRKCLQRKLKTNDECIDMDKTPTIKYSNNNFQRQRVSESVPELLKSHRSEFSKWSLENEPSFLAGTNRLPERRYQPLKPPRKRHNPMSISGESDIHTTMHDRKEKHILIPLGTHKPKLIRKSHKDFGPSSKLNLKDTLGDVLTKHGYNLESNPILPESISSVTTDSHADKHLNSRINNSIVDTSGYDNFARTSEKPQPEVVHTPRFTPRVHDYSLSRSEMGPCFPVFLSDGSPVRKFGHVHSLSVRRSVDA